MTANSMTALPPGSTIGILGGGQLGRMLAMAAARLGFKSHIYAPETDSPAFEVAAAHTIAAYEDEAQLAAFAKAVDVATYEFENIPVATVEFLARHIPVRPGAKALACAQDRLNEKSLARELGAMTAAFATVDSLADLENALAGGALEDPVLGLFQPCLPGGAVLQEPDNAAGHGAVVRGAVAELQRASEDCGAARVSLRGGENQGAHSALREAGARR